MYMHQYPEIEDFLQSLQFEKKYSQHTLIAYRKDLGQFAEYAFEDYPSLQDVKTHVVRSWLAELKNGNGESGAEPLTNKSINRKISALKSFFKYLLKRNIVEVSPMTGVISPKIGRRLPSFVNEKEIQSIFEPGVFEDNHKGRTERLMLTLFYQMGLRLSELINLKKSDIDFSYGQIKILGKGNKERIVPVSANVLRMVKEYVAGKETVKEGVTNLFTNEKGNAFYPKAVYNFIRQLLRDHNIAVEKKSPHVLRHTFATHLMNSGAEMNAIKELMGHSSLAATQIYTHLTIEKLKEVYKQAHPKA